METAQNPTAPVTEKPRNTAVKIAKWSLIILAILAAGFLLLRGMGNIFIKEIMQEVEVKTYGETGSAEIGKQAPFFELTDIEGTKVKLSDFLGSPLVVTFWTTWNSAAADQIKIFDGYLSKNKNNLFEIITINSQENKSAVLNFIKRGGYQIRVLLDEKGAVGELYQARNLPVTYFLDKNGVIQDVFIGVLNEKMLVDKSEKIIR